VEKSVSGLTEEDEGAGEMVTLWLRAIVVPMVKNRNFIEDYERLFDISLAFSRFRKALQLVLKHCKAS